MKKRSSVKRSGVENPESALSKTQLKLLASKYDALVELQKSRIKAIEAHKKLILSGAPISALGVAVCW